MPGLLPVRFSGPLAEPAVRLSAQRALHGFCRQAGFAGCHGLSGNSGGEETGAGLRRGRVFGEGRVGLLGHLRLWKVIPDAFAGETIGVGPHGEEGGRCKSLLLYRYGRVGVERPSRPGGVRGRLQACSVGR